MKVDCKTNKGHKVNIYALSKPIGSPHWEHSELVFEKKELIPASQQLLIDYREATE